ncbi:MAG: hypothetical protein ACOX81_01875 [Candidatus Heteroscillospira sp.]
MTEVLRQWIQGMALTALFCSAAMALTPKGRIKSITRLACTMAMAVAMLTPLCRMPSDTLAQSLARCREATVKASVNGADTADRLSRTIIEEECAAYISDKGTELGLEINSVRVLAKWGDAFWYPYEVWLDTQPSEKLTGWIEGELGVPRERMYWSNEATEAGEDTEAPAG